jgi:hypothetical protein
MNKIIVLLLLLTSSQIAFSQQNNDDFEGEIKYKYSYYSKNKKTKSRTYLSYFGDGVTILIKKGYFVQHYSNASGITDLYHDAKINRIYYKFADRDTLYFENAVNFKDTLFTVHKEDSIIDFLDFPCKYINVNNAEIRTKYLYTESLQKNAAYFFHTGISNYKKFVEATNSIYLQCISEDDDVNSTMTATSVTIRKINDDELQVPNLPTKPIKN